MTRFFSKKDDRISNCQDMAIYLIGKLGLRVSPATIKEVITTHPEYPSLSTISDSLNEWNIENLAINISLEQ